MRRRPVDLSYDALKRPLGRLAMVRQKCSPCRRAPRVQVPPPTPTPTDFAITASLAVPNDPPGGSALSRLAIYFTPVTTKVNRGRPRNPEIDAAILKAAAEVLAERGYARMTVA